MDEPSEALKSHSDADVDIKCPDILSLARTVSVSGGQAAAEREIYVEGRMERSPVSVPE